MVVLEEQVKVARNFQAICALLYWPFEKRNFIAKRDYQYFSERFKKWVTVIKGFICDAATWAPNIGIAWLFHDWLFCYGKWDDGTPIKWHEANRVMMDIMIEEGWPKWVRDVYWRGIKTRWSLKAWKKHRENDQAP